MCPTSVIYNLPRLRLTLLTKQIRYIFGGCPKLLSCDNKICLNIGFCWSQRVSHYNYRKMFLTLVSNIPQPACCHQIYMHAVPITCILHLIPSKTKNSPGTLSEKLRRNILLWCCRYTLQKLRPFDPLLTLQYFFIFIIPLSLM